MRSISLFTSKTIGLRMSTTLLPEDTRRGVRGYMRTGRAGLYRNTDAFFLKIPLYRRIFLKIPIPNIFTASQVFVCISRQPDLNSFKIQRSIEYMFYNTTLHIISNMHFKGIKIVALMNNSKKQNKAKQK